MNRILYFFGQPGCHVGDNKTRRHRIHGDVAAGQFACERFGKADQPCLARAVVCLPGIAHQTNHRADIDDAAIALFGHRTNKRMGKTKRAAQVSVDNIVPIFQRHAHRERVTRNAGVVDQNV